MDALGARSHRDREPAFGIRRSLGDLTLATVDLDDENYGSTTDEEFGAEDFAISPLSSINGSGQPQQQHYYQQPQLQQHIRLRLRRHPPLLHHQLAVD